MGVRGRRVTENEAKLLGTPRGRSQQTVLGIPGAGNGSEGIDRSKPGKQWAETSGKRPGTSERHEVAQTGPKGPKTAEWTERTQTNQTVQHHPHGVGTYPLTSIQGPSGSGGTERPRGHPGSFEPWSGSGGQGPWLTFTGQGSGNGSEAVQYLPTTASTTTATTPRK